jgi:glucose-1-phosphate adenylyltransferase
VLSVPDWPVLSRLPQRAPARVLDGGEVCDSLLSPGSRVSGRVERSVIGPGVVVEPGAFVADSVLFADVAVHAGAHVHWSVLDTRSVVEQDARVGEADAPALDDPAAVTLVGSDCRVGRAVALEAGARLEPGTTRG